MQMQGSNPSRILHRGAMLIAAADIVSAIIGITASCSQLYATDLWIMDYTTGNRQFAGRMDGDGSQAILSFIKVAFGAVLLVNIFILLFGYFLLMGARNGSVGYVKAWYLPNLIFVTCTLLIAFGMAFTRAGLSAMFLPGIVLFRAFETWIAFELLTDLKANKYATNYPQI